MDKGLDGAVATGSELEFWGDGTQLAAGNGRMEGQEAAHRHVPNEA